MTLRLRRSEYAFYYLESGRFFDIGKLLSGAVELTSVTQVIAISILTRSESAVTVGQLTALAKIPADRWISLEELPDGEIDETAVRELGGRGLLLLDDGSPEQAELLRREELLASQAWNIYAALFHFLTRWRDIRLGEYLPQDLTDREELAELEAKNDDAFLQVVDRYGPPPRHFHDIERPLGVQELPLVERTGPLYDALRSRKTTRAYDQQRAVPLEAFASILYYTFGCHGYTPVVRDDIIAIKRTSPSGGGLHPVECYPLVANVAGVPPGLYHYSVRNHALELMEELTREQAAAFANEATAGQSYPRYAGALFIMTARFYRNFWKYRRHNKAYMAILMDAAHLSQTLYTVCADLGLGAFVTGAINSQNIEERLKLDGFEQAPILVTGCGVKAAEAFWEPTFLPYVPRTTTIGESR